MAVSLVATVTMLAVLAVLTVSVSVVMSVVLVLLVLQPCGLVLLRVVWQSKDFGVWLFAFYWYCWCERVAGGIVGGVFGCSSCCNSGKLGVNVSVVW